MNFDEFCSNILVVMATHNRKQIAEICIKNMVATKGLASLCIVNDCSTEYDNDFLKSIAPNCLVVTLTENVGIENLRLNMQRAVKKTKSKFVYHTDNDAYHDPNWLHRLYEMHQKFDGLLGLYNTKLHNKFTLQEEGDIIYRRHCPGISFFFEQSKMEIPEKLDTNWDFVFGRAFKKAAISKVSFVEHFGADGIHNVDFERDRAENPTPWLQAERIRILNILSKNN